MGWFVFIFFVGLYLAARPGEYLEPLLLLLSPAHRARGREVLAALGQGLGWWLLGRAVTMISLGALTTFALWLLGMPLALVLGILAGLLLFVPYLGALAAAVPALLVALMESPAKAFWVGVVYIGLHLFEGYCITPFVQRRAVALPPGSLLSVQLLSASLFGLGGVIFPPRSRSSGSCLTVALERIGGRLHLAGGLLGILTALGADAPEISSSITALSAGHHELGIGVVLGWNIFNLAALLGVSALVAGVVRMGMAGALLNGGVSLLATIAAGALLLGWLPPWLALLLIALLFLPYAFVLALFPAQIKRLPLPLRLTNFLSRAVSQVREDASPTGTKKGGKRKRPPLFDWLLLVPAIFAIVAGSRALVASTVALAAHFAIPHAIAGTLGIAGLTGIPNAIAAIRLATRGRGAAVVAECFNSNLANLVFGICLPGLLIGLGGSSARTIFSLAWLVGMTLVAIALLCWRDGLRRSGGTALVALACLFAAAIVYWSLFVSR